MQHPPTISAFQYTPLDLSTSSIRLVRLLPSDRISAPIQCEIFHVQFGEDERESQPGYVALSYVWGDSTTLVDISLNGQPLGITENLHAALLQLRKRGGDNIFWIDAICIDQSNPRERGHQVQRMYSIYESAVQVIVWLGPQEEESNLVMEYCRSPRSEAWLERATGRGRQFRATLALVPLLKRSWFRRIWVIQEVALANALLLLCGDDEVTGREFQSVERLASTPEAKRALSDVGPMMGLLRSGRRQPNDFIGFNDDDYMYVRATPWAMAGESERSNNLPRLIRRRRNPKYPSSNGVRKSTLVELVIRFRNWNASDPRDKVYALLGLSSDNYDEPDFRPDYTISVGEVYRKFIRYASLNYRYLDVILAPIGFSGPSTDNEIPPWVPDLREPNLMAAPLWEHGIREGFEVLGDRTRDRPAASFGTDERIMFFEGYLLGQAVYTQQGFMIYAEENPRIAIRARNHACLTYPRRYWLLPIPNLQSTRLGDFICLLRGSSSLTVLRGNGLGYTLVGMINSEPKVLRDDYWPHTWTDLRERLAECVRENYKIFPLVWQPPSHAGRGSGEASALIQTAASSLIQQGSGPNLPIFEPRDSYFCRDSALPWYWWEWHYWKDF